MQTKYRSYPKISKLLEYEYFFQIYKKYECNFFRQILPYFSQIVTTDKLEPLKFIYVPIYNPHKIKSMQIGVPLQIEFQNRNPNLLQLSQQATFIKISFQTHMIFQYLMNLKLANVCIQKIKFQDKFWLFTEGIVRNYRFNDLVLKNQPQNMKNDPPGVYFILQGQFKCFNSHKKAFKTIGKGYLINLNGYLKKAKFQQGLIEPTNVKESEVFSQIKYNSSALIQQDFDCIHTVWSMTNNAKIMFLDWNTVKKYAADSDQKGQNIKLTNINAVNTKTIRRKKTHLDFMKYQRLKTQKEETKMRKTCNQQPSAQNPTKKFNLISCRLGNSQASRIILDPIEQISNNQVLKSYIKDCQTFQKMKKQKLSNKHKRFFSNSEKQKHDNCRNELKLLSFFKKQMNDQTKKVNLNRKITKQLNHTNERKNPCGDEENTQDKTEKLIGENAKKTSQNNLLLTKSKNNMQKFSKTQIGAFQLLKRNIFNKEYHKNDFIPFSQ